MVRTVGRGREVSGLYIGARNVRRHFGRDLTHVELQLGDLCIDCDLTPEFWNSRPEIRDHRLADWLFSHVYYDKPCRAPVPVAMVSAGGSAFRIVPLNMPPASCDSLAIFPQTPAPVQLGNGKPHCSDAVCRMRTYINCPMRPKS